jgi:hypothetical protein
MSKFSKKFRKNNHNDNAIDAPMVEIFGGTLALLIILYALINVVISEDIQAMLERSTENAEFKVSWTDGGEGLIILSYPDKLRILETNETVFPQQICQDSGTFLNYVNKLYNNQKQQIIFAILEGGVKTMAKARDCMLHKNPNKKISIGWIIANSDLLNTVKLEDLPVRVKRALTKSR